MCSRVAERLTQVTPPAATPDELWQCVEASWSAVTQEHIQSLFESMPRNNLVALHFKYDFWHMTATAGSDIVQSGRPIFDDFFQHLWPYIGNNTANVVFQMVKRLWLIHIDQ
ncbi:adhesion G protein-coupled receptor B2 [Trichonephila clavipes]|nr:adhesion G protein-coupled receptor B2 [Trichonephila clavipes]